ncbi:MAG TPA: hypothetical protein VHL59_02580, partial [Thermoanaerobaculia bacterium]|nr:hypothetical protein [Thermoanaerobaculia bacterium]
MYLVLCNSSDLAAMWAYLQLKKELGASIDIVTAEVLASALRWEHRLTTNGTSTTIALADGRVIRSDEIRATLNRIEHIAPISPRAGADRDYATAEMHALFASWIHALPGRVWNRATPAGLCGSTWRQSAEWTQLAARAGFAVERQAFS